MPSQQANPPSESDAAGLTFVWPKAQRWYQSRLWRFLGTAVLAHVVAFQLFQIVNREEVTAPGRERDLQLLSHDLPQHQALLNAVEAEIPLAALSHQLLSSHSELLLRPYRSAFAASPSTTKNPNAWTPKPRKPIPSFPAAPQPPPAPSHLEPFSGRIQLSPSLAQRLTAYPEFPAAPPGKLLESPSFWVGVSANGEVQFVFLEHASGDTEADFAAEQAIRKTVFTKSESPTEWGEALLIWRSTP